MILESLLAPMAAWQTYYQIIGTAAATLTGLMFIVVTLIASRRVQRQTSGSGITLYSTPSVVHYAVALLLATIFNAPWRTGLVSEACGEFIDPEHTVLRGLIQRFGLSMLDLDAGRNDRTRSLMSFRQRIYTGEEMIADMGKIGPLIQEQYRQVNPPTTWNRSTPEGQRLDQISASEWIEQYIPGGHSAPLGTLMETACTGFYGLPAREQSSLNLISFFGRPMSVESLESPMQQSSTIVGGNQQLPLAIAASLPSGCLHLHHRLEALVREENNQVRLTFATPAGTREITCEQVILALPFTTLRLVDLDRAGFDERKRQVIVELGYGTISKIFLEFERPVWFEDGPWPRLDSGFVITDRPFQVLWDASPARTGTPGLLVAYFGGTWGASLKPPTPYATTADTPVVRQIAENYLQQIEELFPGIGQYFTGTAAVSYSTGDPNLLGSYACWRVGQCTRLAGYEAVAQGPIHFAGEHCSLEFQGFMEGAAREGLRAAQEILAACRQA